MDTLATLIKMHRRELDRQRRRMADLERQKEDLEDLLRRLRDELARERSLASQNPLLMRMFIAFAERMKQRQEGVRHGIEVLDREIEQIRELLRQGFAELKKTEIARQKRLEREAEEAERKERIIMDELAGQAHERRK